MKHSNPTLFTQVRGLVFFGVLFLACAVFTARLIGLQITGRDNYVSAFAGDYTRTVSIQAQRGEIYDRNGVALVKNEYSLTLVLDYQAMPADAESWHKTILAVNAAIAKMPDTIEPTEILPLFTGEYPNLHINENYLSDESAMRDLAKVIKAYELDENIGGDELISSLLARYKLLDDDGLPAYSAVDMTTLLNTRYDMARKSFGVYTPYILGHNADVSLVTYLRESGVAGVDTSREATRVYQFPGYASHILGRVGPIFENTAEYYSALGYKLDAVVGIDGAEYAYEDKLRGIDGKMIIVEDKNGTIIDMYTESEPIAGLDVYLTIDIGLQCATEKALADNIKAINEKAEATKGELDGEDANAGAITVVSPSTGEILAAASYPTFDLSTFREKYSELSDPVLNPVSPLYNRAFNGAYPPGSVFKPATAAAALTAGIITPKTEIYDTGIYKFYDDFQPRCWIYSRYGYGHGKQNVTLAIQNSCNYFFFEVGRLLTIEKLDEYCINLGLGQPTGLDKAFGENIGSLAGPEYAENHGLGIWQPGDTLQAAIGQSYNLFSPLQLSMYMSALLNGGDRYSAHLLYGTKKYSSDEFEYKFEPYILSSAELSDANRDVIKNALRSVTENGSAARLFNDYEISVGGKTGTAQISTLKSDNAVFSAFAPFDNPELQVTCIIEQGASGTDAGIAVKDIFDYYFGLNKTTDETE
jgi:penicillin-binding protein 2